MNSKLLALGLITMGAFGVAPACADDTGPLSPVSVVDYLSPQWMPTGASLLSATSSSDDVRASDGPGNNTEQLYLSFPVSIPPSATVDGMRLDIEGNFGGAAANPAWFAYATVDNFASSHWASGGLTISGGFPIGSVSPADGVVSMGGPTDTWAISGFSAAEVNGMLEFTLWATDIVFGPPATPDTYAIDNITLTVYYTPVAATPTASHVAIGLTICFTAIAGFFTLRRYRVWRRKIA